MTAEPDLLPELVDEGLDYFNLAGDEGDKLYVRAIRQHIAAKDAEIEALRAEVERVTCELMDAITRADKLAEALDIIARVGKASRNKTTRTLWIVARAISALNGDEDWQALPKPKGFHDALLHPTAAQENGDA